jgi:endonuclease/exonuclease/phosphatase family metal-dependent hydrolase
MTFTIATQNIWGRVPLWPLRKRALASSLAGADIALLQEVQARGKSGSQAHDLAAAMSLTHAMFVSAGRTLHWREGVGIVSRWPILHAVWEKLEQRRDNLLDRIAPRVILRVVIETPVGRAEIYAMHLSLSRDARTRAGSAIAAFARRQRQDAPADFSIFGGDLNASPAEPCIQQLKQDCRLVDAQESSPGRGATFPALWPQRRLDYLLLSPNLRVQSLHRPRSMGSDHCALIAQLTRISAASSNASAPAA